MHLNGIKYLRKRDRMKWSYSSGIEESFLLTILRIFGDDEDWRQFNAFVTKHDSREEDKMPARVVAPASKLEPMLLLE